MFLAEGQTLSFSDPPTHTYISLTTDVVHLQQSVAFTSVWWRMWVKTMSWEHFSGFWRVASFRLPFLLVTGGMKSYVPTSSVCLKTRVETSQTGSGISLGFGSLGTAATIFDSAFVFLCGGLVISNIQWLKLQNLCPFAGLARMSHPL